MKLEDARKAIVAHERIVIANGVIARLPSSEELYNHVASWFAARGIVLTHPLEIDRAMEACSELIHIAVTSVQEGIDGLREEVSVFDKELSDEIGKPNEIVTNPQ